MDRTFIPAVLLLLLTAATAGAQTERRLYTSSELKAMQSRTQNDKPSKEEKKRMKAVEDSINHAEAIKALETLEFALEADQIVFKRGQTAYVTPNTNFVSLSDDRAVIQVAPFNGGGGPNGVGGITLEGRASNIRIKTDKTGNVTFTMSVLGAALSATVTISMCNGGNDASVTVSPNFSSNRVTLNGRLLPMEQSSVFEGRKF